MTHKQHRPSTFLTHLLHFPDCLFLELCIADGQHLVHDQDVGARGGRRRRTPRRTVHAGGVALDGGIEVAARRSAEGHDLVADLRVDLAARVMPRTAPLR
jgi:hypothetical protein